MVKLPNKVMFLIKSIDKLLDYKIKYFKVLEFQFFYHCEIMCLELCDWKNLYKLETQMHLT